MKTISKFGMIVGATLLSLTAYANPYNTTKSAKQCAPAESWSVVKNRCVRIGQAADIIVSNSLVSNAPIYVIFGDDTAELHIKGKAPVIMESVKGGYASQDGELRLLNRNGRWSLRVK